jgi:hypothetical protein
MFELIKNPINIPWKIREEKRRKSGEEKIDKETLNCEGLRVKHKDFLNLKRK